MTPAVGYTEMRDSGIEWVGKIPKEWKVTRMKTILQNVSEKNHPDATVLSLYRDLGVVPKNSRDDNHNVTSEDTSNYKFVRCGDLVINKMKAWQGSLAVSEFEGIVSPAYYVCKFISNSTDKKYLHYLLRCRPYAQEFERLSTGMRVGQWDLGIDDFLRIPVICPSISEQTAIAAYLNTQCAKIDEIIAEVKASIEDYKQWKASIIYEAVTKGLDPNVEMKDSGIEWIGEIPKGWEIKKAKKCVTITNGADPKTEGNIPVYGSGAESFKTCGEYKEGPTVLIGRKGATLHIPHYITGRYWNVDTAFDVKAKAGFSLKYYYYLAYSFDYKYYISQTTLPSMTQTNYNNILLPVPPKETQDLISRVLSTRIEKIDAYIDEKKSLVTDLESYKKSLIYEAVTGKRRVC